MPFNLSNVLTNSRGITAVISLVTALSAAYADGRIDGDEAQRLLEQHVAPKVRETVEARAATLRATRERRGTLGRTKLEKWSDAINDAASIVRFRSWATSALADGKIDAGEVSDLFLAHIMPGVAKEVIDAINGEEDDDTPPGPIPGAIRKGPLADLAKKADEANGVNTGDEG